MTDQSRKKPPTLTKRQREIYEYLKNKIINRGYGPTVREIGVQFNLRSPNGVMCHLNALEKKGFITRERHMSRAIQLTESPQKRMGVRLSGQIVAGKPVDAVEQSENVDFSNLFNTDDHFCLRVKGDSMIEGQIADGDHVVVRKQETCRNGEIAVALIDGEEATLKRFFKEKSRIRLEPANAKMRPIYSNNVQVLGVVVGMLRKY